MLLKAAKLKFAQYKEPCPKWLVNFNKKTLENALDVKFNNAALTHSRVRNFAFPKSKN